MILPDDRIKLLRFSLDLIGVCRESATDRISRYQNYHDWIETGADTGERATINKLYAHVDRLQSHLFSPTDLRFDIDFENHYEAMTLSRARAVARIITREWERRNIDMVFSSGVGEALKYGSCFMKQSGEVDRTIDKVTGKENGKVTMDARLVPPWLMGVYRPDKNTLEDQPCFVETAPIDEYEVWRRIARLPDAESLFKRIKSHASKGNGAPISTSTRNIVSTSQINTSPLQQTRINTGGIVNLGQSSLSSGNDPNVRAELAMLHELWVKDDDAGGWVTIQIIEPDIVIAPSMFMKRSNLFCKGTHPYTLIQPNATAGSIWGRSEIEDLRELQGRITETTDDITRVMGTQYDKLLAFAGSDSITDENYAQFRQSGYINLGTNGSVNDITPRLPAEAFTYLSALNQMFDDISGFDNIMNGRGEAGVRSGVQTDKLARHASPRLRDRSLLIERQCADAADRTLTYMVEKDSRIRWVKPEDRSSDFLLSDIPDDHRISVDSHSGSPIYEEDHKDLIGFGVKGGFVDGESAIELLPYPHKDTLIERLQKKQEAQAKLVQEHPELLMKGAAGHKK